MGRGQIRGSRTLRSIEQIFREAEEAERRLGHVRFVRMLHGGQRTEELTEIKEGLELGYFVKAYRRTRRRPTPFYAVPNAKVLAELTSQYGTGPERGPAI
jgi:hypothetical protein